MKYVVQLKKDHLTYVDSPDHTSKSKELFLAKAKELNITVLDSSNKNLFLIECEEQVKLELQKDKELVLYIEPEIFYHHC